VIISNLEELGTGKEEHIKKGLISFAFYLEQKTSQIYEVNCQVIWLTLLFIIEQ
jgi:hypothetical protein